MRELVEEFLLGCSRDFGWGLRPWDAEGVYDLADFLFTGEEGNYTHSALTAGTQEWVNLEDAFHAGGPAHRRSYALLLDGVDCG